MYLKRVTVKLQARWGPVGGLNATNGGLSPLNPNAGYGGVAPQYLPPSPTLSPNMSPSHLNRKTSGGEFSPTAGGAFSPIRPHSPAAVGFDFNRPDSPDRLHSGDAPPGGNYSPQPGLNFPSSPGARSTGALASGPGLDRPPSSSSDGRMGSPDRPRTVPDYSTIRPDTVDTHPIPYTHYPLHPIYTTHPIPYTHYPLHPIYTTHPIPYTHYPLHPIYTTHPIPYTHYPLHPIYTTPSTLYTLPTQSPIYTTPSTPYILPTQSPIYTTPSTPYTLPPPPSHSITLSPIHTLSLYIPPPPSSHSSNVHPPPPFSLSSNLHSSQPVPSSSRLIS